MSAEVKKMVIDGTTYIAAESTHFNSEVMKLLSSLYGKIWTEACYDPDNDESRRFALRCLQDIQKLNELLGFKS